MRRISLVVMLVIAGFLLPRQALAAGISVVTVTTVVFGDTNGNGMPGVGEHGIAGITVCYTPEKTSPKCVMTDSDGRATTLLPAGKVRIQLRQPVGGGLICTNTLNAKAEQACLLRTTLSTQNPVVLNWLGVRQKPARRVPPIAVIRT